MAFAGSGLDFDALPFLIPSLYQAFWYRVARERFAGILTRAKRIPFDAQARLVFFSDLHRGNAGRADAFVRNRSLFLGALEYYWERGYTYIEVGDGDELWKNPSFEQVRRAHGAVFDALHRFHEADRLFLLGGNHDGIPPEGRDGLPVHEGLLLRSRETEQEILVVHGHQADFKNDRLQPALQWFARHVWRHLQDHGLRNTLPEVEDLPAARRIVRGVAHLAYANQRAIENRLKALARAMGRAIICGHTHRFAFAGQGDAPYFNTGSGIQPGYITGLEITQGQIALIRWKETSVGGEGRREMLAAPQPLALYAPQAIT
ncbi:MAG: hypothetical protein H5T70_04665 [Chloroflexi bacterium]|nr:hypothetical protein [Chloroflexota bacterium]